MQIKSSYLLDKWFNGCGFEAIARITGILHIDINNIDSVMEEAFSIWKKLDTTQQVRFYNEIGFADHQFFNEEDFIAAITKDL